MNEKYDPGQINLNDFVMGAIYKGGAVKTLPFDTGLARLAELEKETYGISGDMLLKADAPVLSTTTGWWNYVYGKKVWEQTNYEPNVTAIISKEPWGRSGWRVETVKAAHGSGYGGLAIDAPAIPETIKPTWVQVSTKPKIVYHGFNAMEVAEFLSSVDDAIDLLPSLREALGKTHTYDINRALCTDIDTVAGNELQSVDRVIGSYSEVTGCTDANDGDIYGLDRDAAASWADAYVSHNSDTDRDLTTPLIDTVLQNVWKNGGKPKVIVTGYDTLIRWQQLLEAERRFLETARVIPTFGGVRGPAPGVEAGFMVATYNGIPILPTQSMPVDTISRIWFIDTDYVKFAVAKPTQYFETGSGADYILKNSLEIEGGYRTMAELRAYGFFAHGKVRDLK